MPAPASQATDVPPLWSRPVAPCVNGWRPNSVLKTTSVSSIRPRAFKSRSRAGDGPVDAAGHRRQLVGDVVMVVPVVRRSARAAPDLHEPHAALEQPAGQQAPPAEVGRGGFFQSVKSTRGRRLAGQVECLGRTAAASGPPARRRRSEIRAACRPGCCAAWRGSIRSRTARPSRSLSGVRNPADEGGNRSGIGRGAPASRITPWCDCGKKPEVKLPLAL